MVEEKLRGKFIAIEGTDGSGKATQTAFLLKKLKEEGHDVEIIDFPRHGEPSGKLIDLYLTGFFGDPTKLDPNLVSGYYAMDRLMNKPKIDFWLDEGKVVIADRYASSNIGHQGAKIQDEQKREELFKWLHKLEFEELKIPKPDIQVFLHVPADVSFELIKNKIQRGYIKIGNADGHEGNIEHLRNAERSYLYASRLFGWNIIECTENGQLLPIEAIHEKIWEVVSKILDNPKP
jgi:dTMP kinase